MKYVYVSQLVGLDLDQWGNIQIAGYICEKNLVTMMSELYRDGSCERISDRLAFPVDPKSRVGPGFSDER